MPTTTLAALDAATAAVPVGSGISIRATGQFEGALLYERRADPSLPWEPISWDVRGSPLQFTAAHGTLAINPVVSEPSAEIRGRLTEWRRGSVTVRLGL